MDCELCGHPFAHKHRIVPGAWGGKYEEGNVILLCPHHHSAIHFLMRWYLRPERVGPGDKDYLLRLMEDSAFWWFWSCKVRPLVLKRRGSAVQRPRILINGRKSHGPT